MNTRSRKKSKQSAESKPLIKRAATYARVSSREQEREGYSIPAQQKLLREHVDKLGYELVREYQDAETARKVGRTSFQLMLEDARKGLFDVLVVEKVDRLTRNFFDLAPIKKLIEQNGLEVHLIKEGEVLGPDSNSNTKFIFNIKVALAENYVDNLSEEIRKGLYEKAAQGWLPHQPPYGYVQKDRVIIVQPEKAAFVKRLYELYATGRYTFETLPDALYAEGYIYLPSKPKMPRQTLEKILKNPFYRGYFHYSEKEYVGKHERFISDELAARVDRVLGQRSHKHVENEFLYQGLITCEKCGCQVIADRKKGKYIYYTCSNSRRVCKREYVREEVINDAVDTLIQGMRLTPEQYQWFMKVMKESRQDELYCHKEALDLLKTQYERTSEQLLNLYNRLEDGIIDQDTYYLKQQELTEKKRHLKAQIDKHDNANLNYQDRGAQIIELAKNAPVAYSRLPMAGKRELLKVLLSNFLLNGREPKPELHFLFAKLVEIARKRNMVETAGVEPASKVTASKRLRA